MRQILAVVFCMALAFSLEAQEVKSSFESSAFPFEGEVTVDRLNVRMFPKTESSSVVVCLLSVGEKVTVIGEKEDFYVVLPPKGSWAWIFGKHLDVRGSEATVTATDVPLRADSRSTALEIGTLAQGTKLHIQKEHLGWYRVDPPEQARFYVGKKCVRYMKPADVKIPDDLKTPPAVMPIESLGEGERKIREAELLIEEQKRLLDGGKIKNVDFTPVIAAYESAASLTQNASMKVQAEESARLYRRLQDMLGPVKTQLEIKERDLEALKAAMGTAPTPTPTPYAFMGFVDTTGAALLHRPGTHKLVLGNKVLCFLKARDNDPKMIERFNHLYQEYVGVTGQIIQNPMGWDGYTVVIVEEIVLLNSEK